MPPKRAIGTDDGGSGRPSKQPKMVPANRARLRTANQNRDKIKATPQVFKSVRVDSRDKKKQDRKSKADASTAKKQDGKSSGRRTLTKKPSKLNVDTNKANGQQLQQPRVPPSDEGAGQSAEDSQDMAPNSVGPPFTPLLRGPDDLQKLVRMRKQRRGKIPVGISNRSGNHCYRNAVLTLLLNSESFVAYMKWTNNDEPDLPDPESLNQLLLRRLGFMAAEVDKDKPETQKRLDQTVKLFWKATCFPKKTGNAQSQTELPMGSWAGFRGRKDGATKYPDSHEEDAAEYLGWILETIYQQLEQYPSANGYDNTGRSSAQRNFNWLLGMGKARRDVCSKCSWRVKRRVLAPREHLWILSLPESSSARGTNPASISTTLVDLIQNDMQTTLAGAQCYRCKRTNVDLERYDDIKQAPEILFICIARYKGKEVRHKNGKVSFKAVKDLDVVEIPDDLELSEFLNRHDYGTGSVVEYRLAGMISHSGESATSGHYHSFVRGGAKKEQWYRINDSRVKACDLQDVNDSKTNTLSSSDFKTRFTPYILMYEINPQTSKTAPGRAAQNVDEGVDEDERPTIWTGGQPREQTPGSDVPPSRSAAPAIPSPRPEPTTTMTGQRSTMPSVFSNIPGIEGEEGYPQARLDLTIELSDKDDNRITIDIPPRFISHFDRSKPRTDISIRATLTAPKAQTDSSQAADASNTQCMKLDLVDRLIRGEIEQYYQNEALKKAKKEWHLQVLQGDEWRKAQRGFRDAWLRKWPTAEWTSAWKDLGVPVEDKAAGEAVTSDAHDLTADNAAGEAVASDHHATTADSDVPSDTIVIDVENYEGMYARYYPAKTHKEKTRSRSSKAAGKNRKTSKKAARVIKPASSASPDKSTKMHRTKRQPSTVVGNGSARKTAKATDNAVAKGSSRKSTDTKSSGVRKSTRVTQKLARFEGA